MSFFGNKPRSLVEQKRLQWAQEREEMANLCAPWGKRPYERYPIRSNYTTDANYYYHRNSLPPLAKTDLRQSSDSYAGTGDQGGETSGYASDCAPQSTPDVWSRRRSTDVVWARDAARAGSPDSVSTTGERLRWGDRGVGVGHLWEPNEVDQRPSVLPGDGSPPGWLQRGLKNNAEIMVVNHGSEKESSEDTESSAGARTYLRGQNIPLDAGILAERERKRQRAIEHQQAICEQLEERERMRKEERERRLREERMEEERIQREREQERERVLLEERLAQARYERERKRDEAMKQALEDAERAAKLDKQKSKNAKFFRDIDNGRDLFLDMPAEVPISEQPDLVKPLIENHNHDVEPFKEPSPRYVPTKVEHKPVVPSPRVEEVQPKPPPPQDPPETPLKFPPDITHHHPHADGLALVLQSTPYATLDNTSLSSLQFALLMTPQHSNPITTIPVTIPLTPQHTQTNPISAPIATNTIPPMSARSNAATNTVTLTENRVLTPTKYRQRSNYRETSTQTERTDFLLEVRPKEYKYGSLDRQTVNRSRRERRMRSEERTVAAVAVDRPKWGVNRPPTQYLTQSEKDPMYQRKKLRQKLRELKVSDDKYSSDESRSPSPTYTHKSLVRRNEKLYLRNVNVYQTEIVPIEADSRGRLFVGQPQKNVATRRQSISEKFLVAKQKRNKEAEFEQNYESRKSRLNQQNESKRLNDEEGNYWESSEVLSQLSSLKKGLILKQKQWDTSSSPRSDPPELDVDII